MTYHKNKSIMNEDKKEWTCSKCNQEIPLDKTDEKFGGKKTIVQINLGNYEVEKENLKTQSKQFSSVTQIKQTQSDSPNQVNTNQNKPNYLPWILGGIGVIALIVGLVWCFTRKENK